MVNQACGKSATLWCCTGVCWGQAVLGNVRRSGQLLSQGASAAQTAARLRGCTRLRAACLHSSWILVGRGRKKSSKQGKQAIFASHTLLGLPRTMPVLVIWDRYGIARIPERCFPQQAFLCWNLSSFIKSDGMSAFVYLLHHIKPAVRTQVRRHNVVSPSAERILDFFRLNVSSLLSLASKHNFRSRVQPVFGQILEKKIILHLQK